MNIQGDFMVPTQKKLLWGGIAWQIPVVETTSKVNQKGDVGDVLRGKGIFGVKIGQIPAEARIRQRMLFEQS